MRNRAENFIIKKRRNEKIKRERVWGTKQKTERNTAYLINTQQNLEKTKWNEKQSKEMKSKIRSNKNEEIVWKKGHTE